MVRSTGNLSSYNNCSENTKLNHCFALISEIKPVDKVYGVLVNVQWEDASGIERQSLQNDR